jgi:phage terminase large subunit-like protein
VRDGEFRFSPQTARRILEFVEQYATHTEGELAPGELVLERWQRLFLVRLFGWLRPDGTRRYRKCFLAVARKNGKTTLTAVIGLYLLCYDSEPGAQVYSCAGDKEQARLMFETARRMVLQSPELLARLKPLRNAIVYESNGSTYKVVSADAKLKHGTNPHGVLFDELHVQPDEKLYEAFNTGKGARRQPLFIMITTAGVFDPESLCWREWQYAEKVVENPALNPHYLAAIYAASKDDEPGSRDTWRKANPNYGVSVKVSDLEEEWQEAQEDPVKRNSFLRYHLNVWTEQITRWMPMERWDACAEKPVTAAGDVAFVGLDLSSTQDVTALVFVFPRGDGTFDVIPRFWIPEETLALRVKRDRIRYDLWVERGLVDVTAGSAVDHDAPGNALRDAARTWKLQTIAYDPWNAHKLVVDLLGEGLPMVDCRQGAVTLSAPTKRVMQHVLEKRYRHGGHDVLRWMAANVMAKEDDKGNVRLVKPKTNGPLKIDGMQALVMAQWAADKAEAAQGPSIYESDDYVVGI